MEQNGILAFRQYVESVAKAHAIKEHMRKYSGITVLTEHQDIQVYDIKALSAIAKEYKQELRFSKAANTTYYRFCVSIRIISKEHGLPITVFCYTDEGEDS